MTRLTKRASVMIALSLLTSAATVHADGICEWVGYCLYESPDFRITVLDGETRIALSDVHALAAWVQYGSHGRAGPIMTVDALSESDGVLTFRGWGPVRGSSGGLVLKSSTMAASLPPSSSVRRFKVPASRDSLR